MAIDDGEAADAGLTPETAFSILGDETRLAILQTLGEADGPLPFSDLFDRVDYDDPPNFNYHLKKVTGHFVDKTDDGYALRQAGQRVVEAVLSGAVTEAPVMEPTAIDRSCQHCGASPIEVEYVEEQIGAYCTECAGQYGATDESDGQTLPNDRERIGMLYLPPAGIHGRTPDGAVDAAFVWTVSQAHSLHRGVCPRCSAAVDDAVSVCEDHDPGEDLCEACNRRYAVAVHSACTNCPFELGGSAIGYLHTDPDLLAFLYDHGLDPFSNPFQTTLQVATFEEEVLGTDPFEARFSFAVDDDAIVLTVDDELTVVDVERNRDSETA